MENNKHPTFSNGNISYVELSSRDINESSSFYNKVFDWEIRTRGDGSVAFDDAVNEASGTWRTYRKPSIELGLLVHSGSQKMIDLLKFVFDAKELRRYDMPDGKIMHAEIQDDDLVIMISGSSDKFPPNQHLIQVYVPNVDDTFNKTISMRNCCLSKKIF